MKENRRKRTKAKHYTTKLTFKLSLLVMILIVSAEFLSFTATIVIGYVTGGTNDTTAIVASVIASVIIGGLLSFIAWNIILHPLNELIKATRRVTRGDYSAHLDMGWYEKHTVKELSQLISNFNEMTTQLSTTELFRKDFTSNFSHEFKTPLVSIRGFARQLYDGDLTPEQQREFSKIILDETEYLTALASNSLLLTNLENRDIVTEKTTFSLDEQLRNCMLSLEPLWSEKNIDIDMELDEVQFHWNEQLLAHVWHNLFDNAVKFTPENGSITVSCIKDGGVITIRVRDSGPGIPADALPHIFERFYQADTSHATKGNGLGLPLVKRIVKLCGGLISVLSETDKGTEFTVTLFQSNSVNKKKD
ncbi:MAG: HAMP domain-containing histidine kinase [Oscillospiraceae bacterium]|nr:HAMP domain-containing histidine kinase [Oscillospiraceae bacterium]